MADGDDSASVRCYLRDVTRPTIRMYMLSFKFGAKNFPEPDSCQHHGRRRRSLLDFPEL